MTYTNESPQARLERLRAELAEREQAASAAAPLPVVPGDTFHAVLGGCTISTGAGFMASAHITTAGENICVTAAMISASYDNFGQSWMAIIDDDAAQIERWGAVVPHGAAPRAQSGHRGQDLSAWSPPYSRHPRAGCRRAAPRLAGQHGPRGPPHDPAL